MFKAVKSIMYKQSHQELRQQLKDQLLFLVQSSESFDNGFDAEAKRLATTVRLLMHDTTRSKSLLNQLNLKKRLFYDSSFRTPGKLIGPYEGLVLKAMIESAPKYVAALDEVPLEMIGKYVPFDQYWNNTVIIDAMGNEFSRKKLILSLANKDGGAHVDPKLDYKYAVLARQYSMGWTQSVDGGLSTPFLEVEKAAVRQIAHEILATLKPEYPPQKKLSQFGSSIMGSVFVSSNPPQRVKKPGRNEPCLCESGRKYKKCHGR